MKRQNTSAPRRKSLAFRLFKPLMHGRYKRPDFFFLGDQPMTEGGAIILSNHVGSDAPITLEFYLPRKVAFWGASEMTSGLISTYRYQSRVYYHEKKHWNLWLARIFCLLASPLTNMFYSGLHMIPTYHDARFVKTLRESTQYLENGGALVIFPEKSDNGYKAELEGFHGGCAHLFRVCSRRGMDVPVYVSYFRKEDMAYIVDAPIMLSQLLRNGYDAEAIADRLCRRCNELGRMRREDLENKTEPAQRMYAIG